MRAAQDVRVQRDDRLPGPGDYQPELSPRSRRRAVPSSAFRSEVPRGIPLLQAATLPAPGTRRPPSALRMRWCKPDAARRAILAAGPLPRDQEAGRQGARSVPVLRRPRVAGAQGGSRRARPRRVRRCRHGRAAIDVGRRRGGGQRPRVAHAGHGARAITARCWPLRFQHSARSARAVAATAAEQHVCAI